MDPLQLGLGLGATLGIAPVERAHYSSLAEVRQQLMPQLYALIGISARTGLGIGLGVC